jgi:hypothetical protein
MVRKIGQFVRLADKVYFISCIFCMGNYDHERVKRNFVHIIETFKRSDFCTCH